MQMVPRLEDEQKFCAICVDYSLPVPLRQDEDGCRLVKWLNQNSAIFYYTAISKGQYMCQIKYGGYGLA